ncbi:SH3 domain-containing protein [Siminovitchia fortis]|uniref:SH3 domain-containing protein n=1 Tax=Siminovitchia fortis TaxID=254758 RepID=UPI0011A9F481|nr:SH3 domain-containing protein [Siminovitchia fortis]
MKKKIVIPGLCFAALSTVAFEEAVQAAEPPAIKAQAETKYVSVNQGSALNVRSSASSSSSVIAKLPSGTKVSVQSESGGWAKVTVNGKTGYVSAQFLSSGAPASQPVAKQEVAKQEVAPAPAKAVTKYINVNSGSSLNMRNSASTSGSVIGKLTRGTKVSVQSEAGGWAKIAVNGKTGYVSTQYLSTSVPVSQPKANIKQASTLAPAKPAAKQASTASTKTVTKYVNVNPGSSLNVRSKASTSGSVIAKLASGSKVSVQSESGGWAKITVSGKTGYVSTAYLAMGAPANKPSANKVPPTSTKTVTKYVNVNPGSSLNVRSKASTSGSVIAKLSSGSKVSVQSESGGWAKVTVNGKTGYVSTAYLATSTSANKPSANKVPPTSTKTVTKYVNVNPGSSLNVRSKASTSGSVIAKLSSGSKVSVQSESGGWAKITVSGKTGYVSTAYLGSSAPANKPAANKVPSTSTKTVTKYVNVNPGSSLNVRSKASTSGSVIAKLTSGSKVSVQSESGGWAKVTVNGKTGYVSTAYLAMSTPANKPAGNKVPPTSTKTVTKYVNVNPGSSLNVRSKASTSGSVIAKLSSGSKVSVQSESGGWAKVTVNGKTGYVSTAYLATGAPANKPAGNKVPPTSTKTVTKYVSVNPGSSLNVRSKASTSGSVIAKLSSGSKVSVQSESGGWAKITVNGKTGYVSSEYLSAKAPSAGSPVKNPVKTTTKYVNVNAGSTLYLRSKASTSASIVDRLTRGTAVKVESEANGWAKVSVNGKTGYVSSEFLSETNGKTETAKPKTKYINTSSVSGVSMYKSASTNASIIIKIGAGVPVQVYSEEKGWAKVKAYDSDGYIQSKFLSDTKPESKPSEEAKDQTNQIKYVAVNPGSNLNMRSGPSATAAIIAKLANGTAVTYHSESGGWAKVTANGKTGYVSTTYLSSGSNGSEKGENGSKTNEYSNYNLTLDEMVKIQMAANPQTDKQYATYIREDALKLNSNAKSGTVLSGTWNVRSGAGTNFSSLGKVSAGSTLNILSSKKDKDGYTWYQVQYKTGWVTAKPEDVKYYLDPNNFINDPVKSLQFINLSKTANAQAAEINEKILSGKGILSGKAASFIEAGKIHGVNEMYLISHALLETGNGTSQLARGVKVNGKTVYNMYGIGAYDGSAVQSGAQFAYNAGWFTPEAAIIGGAQFIGKNYISAGQNTLYKMRWNPQAASNTGKATHQYATDIGWAVKQITQIHNLYMLVNSYTLVYDIPVYRKL